MLFGQLPDSHRKDGAAEDDGKEEMRKGKQGWREDKQVGNIVKGAEWAVDVVDGDSGEGADQSWVARVGVAREVWVRVMHVDDVRVLST